MKSWVPRCVKNEIHNILTTLTPHIMPPSSWMPLGLDSRGPVMAARRHKARLHGQELERQARFHMESLKAPEAQHVTTYIASKSSYGKKGR